MTNKTIPAQAEPQATATERVVVEEPRVITYPLKTGGSLTTPCPSWCTVDHSNDVAQGIHPGDLLHQGDAVSLDYAPDGVAVGIMQGRIQQWPFDDGIEGMPHVEYTPDVNTGVSLFLHSRLELDDEIRRVRSHLGALIELGDQLANAQADDHALSTRGDDDAWGSLPRTSLQTLPIAYLLKVFGVTVVETEDIGRKAVAALYGKPGAMELRVLPDLSQYVREDQARRQLLDWYDARFGGGRGEGTQADEALRRVRGEAV